MISVIKFILNYLHLRLRVLTVEWRATLTENNGTERVKPSIALVYVNFTRVILRPTKRLKLIGSLFPEKSSNVYSGLSKEYSTVVITIVCIVCFEAVVHGLQEISNNQLNVCGPQELDFRLIIKHPEITQVKVTYPSQHPLSNCSLQSLVEISKISTPFKVTVSHLQ